MTSEKAAEIVALAQTGLKDSENMKYVREAMSALAFAAGVQVVTNIGDVVTGNFVGRMVFATATPTLVYIWTGAAFRTIATSAI